MQYKDYFESFYTKSDDLTCGHILEFLSQGKVNNVI